MVGWSRARTPHLTESVITVVGLVLSVASAVLVPVLVPSGVVDDLLLSIVTFVLGYLLTMDLAFRTHLREMELRLMERFEEAERRRFGALPLQHLLTVPEIEDAVRDIVAAAANARTSRMPFLANRTIERIRRDRVLTERIAQGTFLVEDRREELRLVRLALEESRQTLDAVAGLGLAAWRTHEMQEYFDLYLAHAARLEQRRVFLVNEEEMADEEMIRLLQRHEDAGVEVYALDRRRLSPALCRPLVLFDAALLLVHTRESGDGIEVRFTDDPLRAQEAAEDMRSLLAIARRGDPRTVLYPPAGAHSPRVDVPVTRRGT